jgi:hypothetical protein
VKIKTLVSLWKLVSEGGHWFLIKEQGPSTILAISMCEQSNSERKFLVLLHRAVPEPRAMIRGPSAWFARNFNLCTWIALLLNIGRCHLKACDKGLPTSIGNSSFNKKLINMALDKY